MLEITHATNAQVFKVDTFWLRDHCRCIKCYNVKTNQRRHNLLDIPATIEAQKIAYNANERSYQVLWSDGHISNYDIDWLYNSQLPQKIARVQNSNLRLQWNNKLLHHHMEQQNLSVNLSTLLHDNLHVKKIVSSLIRFGIAFINEVPADTESTEFAIRQIFPIMRTFFGDMWTFNDNETIHADTAYTQEYLGSHTDNTYFCDAAGLQILHCIQHVNGVGGENFFVDGLFVANELKRCNPKAFKMLTEVQVPAEYIEDGQHHAHTAPIIRVDPLTNQLLQMRVNVYDRAAFDTLPQEKMNEFYNSYRALLRIIQLHENQFTVKLLPGTIVLFDNWRVFHGRQAYTGSRTMTGCYVQRTDYLSKARILGIIE